MRFEDILTNDAVLDGLYDMHFDECTPIQEKAIPPILEGKDILACAQTGTGKTAAYLLPVIDMLSEGGYPENSVNCVVMAPTRELAQQIDRQLQGFSYFMPVSGVAIYGGTDGYAYEQQRKSLKMGADIVIATPGRLLAHLSMGYVDLSKVSFFILDEADRMLDMGFYDDIMQIYSHLPKECQTLLFSATMPQKIQQMAAKILKDPEMIKLAVSKPADKIRQSAYICYETQKLPILRKLFEANPPQRVIIFSSSKQKVKVLSRGLKALNINIAEMHSDLDQDKRDNVMLDFKAGRTNVIVATDILARGIDIDDIEMVVNFDVPREAEDYVHRIGRTARANRDGLAVTFVSPEETMRLKRIERLLEKEVPKEKVPEEFGEAPNLKNSRSSSGSRNSSIRNRSNRGHGKKNRRERGQEQEDMRQNSSVNNQTKGDESDSKVNQESTNKNHRNRRRRWRGARKQSSDSSNSRQATQTVQ